jgi:tRNA wybutosine-synthesizing protein 2
MRQTPFEQITKSLSVLIPAEKICFLPKKWEKIGTVVTLKLPDELLAYQELVGKVYADVLGCWTTLNDTGGIIGVYREPVVEVIYGSQMTETLHIENGIRFKLNPRKIMFSSGNMAERKRMARISNPRETVVDLFAGIGYFSLPMAVKSKPKKIFACEINPVSYKYLCMNIVLNQVTDRIEPLLGDNQKVAPKGCADRVLIGYLEGSKVFLPTAFNVLKNQIGILHYHAVEPVECNPQQPLKDIELVAKNYHRSVELLKVTTVKSYAPGIDHVVLDVRSM